MYLEDKGDRSDDSRLSTESLERIAEHKDKRRQLLTYRPMRWGWLCDAGRLSGKVIQVACILNLISCLRSRETVRLERMFVDEMRLDDRTVERSLKALEETDLIRVERKRGRKPRSTLQWLGRQETGRRSLYLQQSWGWMCDVGRLPGKSMQVAFALDLTTRLRQRHFVQLEGEFAEEMGLERRAIYRATDKLEPTFRIIRK